MPYKKIPSDSIGKFMVFIKGHEAPKYQHDKFNSAAHEAHRLAKKFPNEQVYICKLKVLVTNDEVVGEI